MAEIPSNLAFWSAKDAAGRDASWSIRVDPTQVATYVAAANTAARAATNIGMLIAKNAALSELSPQEYGVRYSFIDDAITPPAADSGILRGNKVVIQYNGSGRGFVTSVPCRDVSVLTITNGTEVVLADGGVMAAFVSQFELSALDINGNAVTVTGAYLND